MSYRSSSSDDFQLFASAVDPMPNTNRFTTSTTSHHRPKHHVKFSNDVYEEGRVVEAPRKAHVTQQYQLTRARDNYVVQEAEDVDDEAAEFIKLEHKKFLLGKQSSMRDY